MSSKSQIILDNPSGIFYAGQVVSGRFELVVEKELKVTAINFISKGRAKVLWTEGGGQHSRTYYATEKYYHNKIRLYGKEQTGKDSVVLQPGSYTYPFSCEIPATAPSSFEPGMKWVTAWVRHSLKAHVDIPWAIDKYTKRMITVVRPLDLNSITGANAGAAFTAQKNLCCLCCASNPITATVTLNRTGYVPGESIVFRAEIHNGSSRTMTCSKAKLKMDMTCHTSMKTRTFSQGFSKKKHGKIDGGDTDVWMDEKLHIPPLAPSYLQGCGIIELRYYAQVTVDPSGPALDLDCPVEVIIGTVPLQSVAQEYGMTLPSSAPEPVLEPPPGAPRNIYSETVLPTNIPNITMSESASGRAKIKQGKSGSETVDYAPMYTYYNWGKPELDSMFTVQEK